MCLLAVDRKFYTLEPDQKQSSVLTKKVDKLDNMVQSSLVLVLQPHSYHARSWFKLIIYGLSNC